MTSKLRLGGTFATLVALGLAAHPAAAQSAITFSAPVSISGDSDVSTAGTLLSAISSNTNGPLAPVNGVTFTPSTATGGTDIALTNITANYNPGTDTGLSSAYQAVIDTANYNNNGATPTIGVTISGLTVGDTYEFQFFVEEPRSTSGRTETLSDGFGDTSGLLKFDTLGSYDIGTFIAAAAGTEAFTVNGLKPAPGGFGDTAAQINALQVRDITPAATPEPSQSAALGLGVLGLGALALKARKRSLA